MLGIAHSGFLTHQNYVPRSLSASIKDGDIASVKSSLEQGVNVNEPCHDGELPLAKSVKELFRNEVLTDSEKTQKFRAIFDILLSHKAKAHSIKIDSQPLLFYLCEQAQGHLYLQSEEEHLKKEEQSIFVIDSLFNSSHAPDINETDQYQRTPILCGSIKLAKLFLKWGANIAEGKSRTVIHQACQKGDIAFIEELLNRDATLIYEEDSLGCTALDYAKNPEVKLLLLKRGAKSKQQDILYHFQDAQRQSSSLLLDFLLENGLLTFKNSHGFTALHFCRTLSATQLLLSKGALELVAQEHLFSLVANFLISLNEQLEYLHLLHAHGMDFTLIDEKSGDSFLHLCIHYGLDVIQALVSFGTALNVQNKKNETALHLAAHHGLLQEMQFLLEQGADIKSLDEKNETALEKIEYFSFKRQKVFSATTATAILDALLPSFPQNVPLKNGIDLLFISIHCNSLPLVQNLSQRKVSLVAKHHSYSINSIEFTATENRPIVLKWLLSQINLGEQKSLLNDVLSLAVSRFYFEIAELLLAAGADVNGRNKNNELALFSFASGLDMGLGQFESEEQCSDSAVKTLQTLFKHGLNLEISQKPGALITELIDYRGRNWPLIEVLLNHGVSLPVQKNLIFQLIGWAINSIQYLSYIVDCLSKIRWRQDLLSFIGQLAVKKSDTKLLDQCLAWGLNLQHVLLYERLQGCTRYLLDEVTDPFVICYFIRRGAVLHYPRMGLNSLLHRAAIEGWLEVLELLLEPDKRFAVDMLNYDGMTALQLAVEAGHASAIDFLLNQGADPLVKDKRQGTLLQIACKKGHEHILPILIRTKIDIDFHVEPGEPAILIASYYNDKAKAEIMVGELLKAQAKWSFSLIFALIYRHFNEEIVNNVLSQCSKADIFDQRLLHLAVKFNNSLVSNFILNRYPDQIDLADQLGRTPLHLATAPGLTAIFEQLRQQGANQDKSDYQGYSVSLHALFNNTYIGLGLDPKLPTAPIKRLATQLLQRKEFENSDHEKLFLLSTYCYKLISIFGSVDSSLKFIKEHQNNQSNQPIHDLCLFQLPSQPYLFSEDWIALLFKYGTQITPFLHLAPRIEQLLGKPVSSLDEIKQIAEKIRYSREMENSSLAELAYLYHAPENVFNRILDNFKPKNKSYIPDITIEGAKFNEPRFYLKKLADTDCRGFFLGEMTHCCQSAGSAGEPCAMHGMLSPYSGFYAVFKKTPENELKTMQVVLKYLRESSHIESFLKKFHQKSQREKYKKMHTLLGDFALLRQKLENDFSTMQEGELIAQMWAWISQSDALVLDSWERLRDENDHLCLPFLKQMALQMPNRKLYIGIGGQTPQLPYEKSKNSEVPKDYFGYRDSREQYLIAEEIKQIEPVSIASPVAESTSSPYTAQQMQNLLENIFAVSKQIKLLPALSKENSFKDQLQILLDLPKSLPPTKLDTTHCGILPFLTPKNLWSACIIEYGLVEDQQDEEKSWSLFTYLDLSKGPLPQELYHLPRLQVHNISQVPLVYNLDPGQSGTWLIEILKSYAQKGFLEIKR